MQISKVKVDSQGRLAGSGIHDAIVKEFFFVEGKYFTVNLLGAAGEKKSISLNGVVRIGLRDVVNGTVISDVYCWRLCTSDAQIETRNDAWRVLLAGNYIEKDFPDQVERLTKQYSGYLFIFLESSYGGSIAAICTAIE